MKSSTRRPPDRPGQARPGELGRWVNEQTNRGVLPSVNRTLGIGYGPALAAAFSPVVMRSLSREIFSEPRTKPAASNRLHGR